MLLIVLIYSHKISIKGIRNRRMISRMIVFIKRVLKGIRNRRMISRMIVFIRRVLLTLLLNTDVYTPILYHLLIIVYMYFHLYSLINK